jgi:hypothetical protein
MNINGSPRPRRRVEPILRRLITLSDEIKTMLEKATEYIVKKCADETISGSYYVHADDVPGEVLAPGLFVEHIDTIADMILGYESVAEADVEDGVISVIMYTDCCPNHEPSLVGSNENDDYGNQTTPNPLTKRQFTNAFTSIGKIEDLFTEAVELFATIPFAIQSAILAYHNEPATIQYCLRWGLQASKEIRSAVNDDDKMSKNSRISVAIMKPTTRIIIPMIRSLFTIR